jgi:hypothetical protein
MNPNGIPKGSKTLAMVGAFGTLAALGTAANAVPRGKRPPGMMMVPKVPAVLGPPEIKYLLDNGVSQEEILNPDWQQRHNCMLRADVAEAWREAQAKAAREREQEEDEDPIVVSTQLGLKPIYPDHYGKYGIAGILLAAMEELGREPTVLRVIEKARIRLAPKKPGQVSTFFYHTASGREGITKSEIEQAFDALFKRGIIVNGRRDPINGVSLASRYVPFGTGNAGAIMIDNPVELPEDGVIPVSDMVELKDKLHAIGTPLTDDQIDKWGGTAEEIFEPELLSQETAQSELEPAVHFCVATNTKGKRCGYKVAQEGDRCRYHREKV